ncbi:hypothetical protein [Nocardia sp. NPDC058705]|uniref:hypothetical protein n=1 Tax=Nocardia sp. NPDC058705 TaxID=3346609 RepID=UPI0036B0FE4D
MDISVLHTLTEDLASFLSEVTQGDLGRAVPHTAGDVGDLYLRLLEQNISVATTIAGEPLPPERHGLTGRASLEACVDHNYGGAGLEAGYRRSARLMEDAFASVADTGQVCRLSEIDVAALYEDQISNTVLSTWDLADALGDLPYRPAADVARRVLWTAVLRLRTTADQGDEGLDDASAFACVLALSGRVR